MTEISLIVTLNNQFTLPYLKIESYLKLSPVWLDWVQMYATMVLLYISFKQMDRTNDINDT